MKTIHKVNIFVSFTASDAKNNFGKLIDAAQRQPVTIRRRGRAVAYVVSPSDMEEMEDFFLGLRAQEIVKRGTFLGVEKTAEYMKKVLNHARN